MAIQFDASGEYLNRTSGAILDQNSAYTVAGWVKRTVADSTFHLVFYMDGGTNYNNNDHIILNWFGGAAGIHTANGGLDSGNIYGTTSLVTNTYYHLAMVRESATSLKLFVNASLEVTLTEDITGRVATTRMSMAALPNGDQPSTGLITGAWNAWTRALGSSELTSQMAQAAPFDATSEWAEWLMQSGSTRGDDTSGNARHWTQNGTLTDTTDPSITYPSAGAASLPFVRQRMPQALLAR